MAQIHITLASSSPQRLALLKQIGVAVAKVAPQDIDETYHPKEDHRTYVQRMAMTKVAKALQEQKKNDGGIILAADTIVLCSRGVIGKPVNRNQANDYLSMLSGGGHRILTAIAVHSKTFSLRTVTTRLTFKRLDRWEIIEALESNEWQGKAGAYAIQGLAGGWVRSLSGSFSNVVGLPLYETRQMLISHGWSPRSRDDAVSVSHNLD